MIKRLLLLVFLLMACIPETGDSTPTREVFEPTATAFVEVPAYYVNAYNDTTIALAPEPVAGGYEFQLVGFEGSVGVTTDWYDTTARTCYLIRAEAELNLANHRCYGEDGLPYINRNFAFRPRLHYEDGSFTDFYNLPLRAWWQDAGGSYTLLAPLLPTADGKSYAEMSFFQTDACANHGNSVTITNVTLEVAPSPDYCAQLGG